MFLVISWKTLNHSQLLPTLHPPIQPAARPNFASQTLSQPSCAALIPLPCWRPVTCAWLGLLLQPPGPLTLSPSSPHSLYAAPKEHNSMGSLRPLLTPTCSLLPNKTCTPGASRGSSLGSYAAPLLAGSPCPTPQLPTLHPTESLFRCALTPECPSSPLSAWSFQASLKATSKLHPLREVFPGTPHGHGQSPPPHSSCRIWNRYKPLKRGPCRGPSPRLTTC